MKQLFRPHRFSHVAWLGALSVAGLLVVGCKSYPPGGSPIEVIPLGSVVDQANRIQEENAEPAKFIIAMHEFELNKPLSVPEGYTDRPSFQGLQSGEPRGFRLTPYGQDHVRQIARQLLLGNHHQVMVERSNTSKLRNTVYRYPVHYNPHLDGQRREVVVEALAMLGVENADELVVVTPAFPEGLHSDEAIQAFQNTRFGNGNGNGGQGSGGAGGLGGGGIQ